MVTIFDDLTRPAGCGLPLFSRQLLRRSLPAVEQTGLTETGIGGVARSSRDGLATIVYTS
jgi:hypothetical protein